MTRFSCKYCSYYSDRKYDYDKHIKTKKHIEKSNKRAITDFTNVNNNTDNILSSITCNINATQDATQDATQYATQDQTQNNIMNHICNFCNKSFNKHQSYYRHKKYFCKKAKELNNANNTFTCNYCEKVFNNHSSYYRHMKHFCKHRLEEENNFNNRLIPFNQNSHNTNTNNSYNSTVNNVGQINNNIIIKNFGAEDTSHLTDEFMYEMIRAPQKMMLPMIEKIHLDENKPENKNIKVPNIRENTYKVYDQGKWLYKDRDEIIKDMVDAKCYEVDRFFTDKIENNKTDFEKNITKYHKTKYVEFQSKYDTEDKDIIGGLFKDCKLALISLRKELNKD